MSSFNLIEKVKYNKPQNGVVFVREYIVFEDDHNDEKFVLFKLYNQLNQTLNHIIYEVLQYDSEERLIEKKILEYDNFNARAQECFVPKAKLRLHPKCKNIVCNLIKADFETIIWENGNFTKIPESFEGYREIKKEVAGPKIKQPKKVNNKVKEKKKFYVKNIIARNTPKFSNIFTSILAVLSIVFFVVTIFIVGQDDKVYYKGIDYQINEDSLIVVSCDYNLKEVYIPEKIDKKVVIAIADNAFAKSKVETVVINSETINIGKKAFYECVNLVNFTAKNIEKIGTNAFANCYKLTNFNVKSCKEVNPYAFSFCEALEFLDLKDALVNDNSFIGCNNINTLFIGECKSTYFGSIFGLDNENISNKLENVYTYQSAVSNAFFYKVSHRFNVYINNPNCIIDRNAITDVDIIG